MEETFAALFDGRSWTIVDDENRVRAEKLPFAFMKNPSERGLILAAVPKPERPSSLLYGLVDADGKTVLDTIYDEVGPVVDARVRTIAWRIGRYEENAKGRLVMRYGLASTSGEVLIPPTLEALDDASSDGLWAGVKKGDFRLIDASGKTLVELKTKDRPARFGVNREELSVFVLQSKGWSIVRRDGSIAAKNLDLEGYSLHFRDGVAWCSRSGKHGALDTDGNELQPFVFDESVPTGRRLARIRKGDKWGFSIDGGAPFAFDYPEFKGNDGGLREGRIQIFDGAHYGFADETGKPVCACEFDQVGWFSEGVAWVKKGERVGLLDLKGRVSAWTEDLPRLPSPFLPGRSVASAQAAKGWVLVDRELQIKAGPFANLAEGYGEDFWHASVWAGDVERWGLLRADGTELLAPSLIDSGAAKIAWSFRDGRRLVAATLDGVTHGLIDREGHWVRKPVEGC